jgi:glycine oxidase
MQPRSIIVAGAGITGLWQALMLARRGHRVQLIERSSAPFSDAASAYAGAMLGPFCETEASAPVVRELGIRAIELWRHTFPGTESEGTLVISGPRDRSEIERFARLTQQHRACDSQAISALEPDLAGRFAYGLFYPGEGHVSPRAAMQFLLEEAGRTGVQIEFGTSLDAMHVGSETLIDCRGLGARSELADLRGVRGERLIVRTSEIRFRRPIRFLHPRHSIYVVPWGNGLHMVGATVIESDDAGPITVRSALELLGMAYALHPAFGEAEIVEAGAGVRPALPDNIPKIIVRSRTIHVNGMYRHGFLLAPVLAELLADYLENDKTDNRVFVFESNTGTRSFTQGQAL